MCAFRSRFYSLRHGLVACMIRLHERLGQGPNGCYFQCPSDFAPQMSCCGGPSRHWPFSTTCQSPLPTIKPNGTCAWSKCSRRLQAPFAASREPGLLSPSQLPIYSTQARSWHAHCPWLPSLLVSLCRLPGHLGSYKTSLQTA